MINVTQIIERFGGITNLSRILGHRNPSTVQGWKENNKIPVWRFHEIKQAAKRHKIKVMDLLEPE